MPFESVAYEHGLELESSVDENIRVNGNSQQLVSILIDNGIRHSKSGHSVEISLFNEKRNAILSVVNEGTPIQNERKELLFERFYRADEARNVRTTITVSDLPLQNPLYLLIFECKGASALNVVREIIRRVKYGNNVMIFPEGSRSFHGETIKQPESIAKLKKKQGAVW